MKQAGKSCGLLRERCIHHLWWYFYPFSGPRSTVMQPFWALRPRHKVILFTFRTFASSVGREGSNYPAQPHFRLFLVFSLAFLLSFRFAVTHIQRNLTFGFSPVTYSACALHLLACSCCTCSVVRSFQWNVEAGHQNQQIWMQEPR